LNQLVQSNMVRGLWVGFVNRKTKIQIGIGHATQIGIRQLHETKIGIRHDIQIGIRHETQIGISDTF
jgi:hypothetical protein